MYLEWGAFFEIGIPRIDAEHRRLVEILNQAWEEGASGQGESYQVLNQLVRYFEDHFASEERLMQAVHFPELARQRVMHQQFAQSVFDFTRRLEQREAGIENTIFEFLRSWVVEHVLGEDRKIGTFCAGREIPQEYRTS